MIPVLGAAFLILSLSGSLAFAQRENGSQSDQTIQPAAKSGVYNGLKKHLGKMQQTRAEKDRLNDKIEQINSKLEGKKH